MIDFHKGKKLEKNVYCEDCAKCWVMKTDEKLRFFYDKGSGTKFFQNCGKRFDGTVPYIYCFTSEYAKELNWKNMEEYYLEHKKELDEYYENYKKQKVKEK